ncbi:type 2 DNA topoisomerase 6 subunit B-like isoform X16 [Kogia breviceps]|uniref:type 2 DNA topoisomerase 6 subunit B-like isoform X16 n=1 Tax=Kogia breviceps TaxID=27615 RepID=UPI0034D1D9A9
MEGTAVAVCEILKYLIIHWRCETARISKGALLEGELVISIEALNSKHQANTLHCVTTIASAGSIFGGLVLKKFLKGIQSILPGLSAELSWTSEEASYSRDVSGVTPFQMIFEVHEKPKTLMTDSLVIKNFLRRVITVLPKIRFNFSVKVNGILSMEIFGTPKFGTTELLCSRIHPVLGHPVMLSIPDDVAKMGLLGELILTPAAALCPCPKVFSNQLNRISSASIFLYGPSGLPLILPNLEQPTSTIFKDTSYFINWKKYHLCMVPNLDFNLDRGVHTLLTTHLSAILTENHGVVQDSIQVTVDQALEQHHQAVKAHQKLQASLSVAVNSIMSIITGSTSSSFRKTCLQTLQAADTQEFGTKLHKSFHEITQNRFLHHCSREVKQLLPEKNNAEQSTEDAHENSSLELLAETSGQVEKKSLKRGGSLCQGVEETRAFHSPRALNPSEDTLRRAEPTAAPLTPRSGLEDALWLQEISNLSEWLSPGSAS